MLSAFKKYFSVISIISCLLIVCSVATAQESHALNAPNNAEYIVKIFSGLAFIVVLILAVARVARRLGSGTLLAGSHLKLVGSLALGAREKLVIVEIGERQLLLGVTSQSIQTLHKIETPLTNGKPLGDSADKGEDGFDFRQKLQEILGKSVLR